MIKISYYFFVDRHADSVSRNKLLNTDHNSNIFFYLTGHGGENFMKFRNVEEISAHDLSAAFNQMWQQGRYKEILFVIDTCQAASMFSKLRAPNVYGIASSKVGESSYSVSVHLMLYLKLFLVYGWFRNWIISYWSILP